MIRRAATRLFVLMAGLCLAAGLAGCFNLFPSTKPAQLYRFDATLPSAPPAGATVAVQVRPLDFDDATSGDRILTVHGEAVAYIKGARWAIPAAELFQEAIEHGFGASGGAVQPVGPGQSSIARDRLRLEVTRFEARYENGPGGAPTIVVRLRAEMQREGTLAQVGEKVFEADIPASANRVGAIVEAFNQATTQVVGALVTWVEQTDGA